MKKFVLALVSCVVIAYGCKPVDHSQSEEKGLGTALKKGAKHLFKTGKLSDEVLVNIKKLSKVSDDATEKQLKEILKKGGDQADEAVLAYNRAYEDALSAWAKELSFLSGRYTTSLRTDLPPSLMNSLIDDVDRGVRNLADILQRRADQADRILISRVKLSDTTEQMNKLAIGGETISGFGVKKQDGSFIRELVYPNSMQPEMKFIEVLRDTPGRLSGLIKESEKNMVEAITAQTSIQEKIASRLKYK